MIVDTSALIAILTQEPDAELYIQAIGHAPVCRISAAIFVELFMVIDGQFGPEVSRQCDMLLRRIDAVVEPFTADQAHLARQAFLDFGKGRHQASLNYSDCLSYALAKITGEPLLYKGNDFAKTDIPSAISQHNS